MKILNLAALTQIFCITTFPISARAVKLDDLDSKGEINGIEYYLYKKGAYEKVLISVDKRLPTISNSKLKPKFELLKAYAIGKHLDLERYKEALKFIAINYGNREEGKKAKEILNQLNK